MHLYIFQSLDNDSLEHVNVHILCLKMYMYIYIYICVYIFSMFEEIATHMKRKVEHMCIYRDVYTESH